jgi:hypothetical protein
MRTNFSAIKTIEHMLDKVSSITIADEATQRNGDIELSVRVAIHFTDGDCIVGHGDNVPDAFARAVVGQYKEAGADEYFRVIRGLNSVEVRQSGENFRSAWSATFGDMEGAARKNAYEAMLEVASLSFNELWGRV